MLQPDYTYGSLSRTQLLDFGVPVWECDKNIPTLLQIRHKSREHTELKHS